MIFFVLLIFHRDIPFIRTEGCWLLFSVLVYLANCV